MGYLEKMANLLYVAKLQCMNCGETWKDLPRGPEVNCPKACTVTIKYDNHQPYIARSKSVKWLNYDETFGQECSSDLKTWDETYGQLTNKQVKKLLRKTK